jgi:hypothetical protein
VTAQNLWPVVGAKLGYPNVPQVGQAGPPRASDRIGDILRECHKKYLMNFEQAYLHAVGRNYMSSGSAGPQRAMAAHPGFNAPLNAEQLTPQQQNAIHQAGTPLKLVMQYAPFTSDQLKERGLHDTVIAFVERSRPVVTRNVLKVPEDGPNGLQQQQQQQPPPRLPATQQGPTNNMQRTPVMTNQTPTMSNGDSTVSQPQVPHPGSLQRPNAPGVLVLPDSVNVPNNLPIPAFSALPAFRPSREDVRAAYHLIAVLRQLVVKEGQSKLRYLGTLFSSDLNS